MRSSASLYISVIKRKPAIAETCNLTGSKAPQLKPVDSRSNSQGHRVIGSGSRQNALSV